MTAHRLGYQDGGGVTPVAQDGRANPIRAHDDNAFAGVDLAGDTRIQHLEQGVQVSVGAGFDESSGDDAMLGWLHAGRNARFVDLATGPMSQLPACGGLAANRRGDLLVGQPKDLVQHEHHPLRGAEALEHDQQSQPDLVVESHPVSRVNR